MHNHPIEYKLPLITYVCKFGVNNYYILYETSTIKLQNTANCTGTKLRAVFQYQSHYFPFNTFTFFVYFFMVPLLNFLSVKSVAEAMATTGHEVRKGWMTPLHY